jgi:Flp pilus assembly protein TadD
VRAALNLAAVHLDRGEPRVALDLLDRAAALAPGDPEVELNRAIAIEQQGDAKTARARLDALADASPGFWPAALRAGHLALDAHDWTAAGARYESVLRVHPLSAEAWAGLGVVREREGRRDDARRALERSLALDPGQDNAAALRALLARLGP